MKTTLLQNDALSSVELADIETRHFAVVFVLFCSTDPQRVKIVDHRHFQRLIAMKTVEV